MSAAAPLPGTKESRIAVAKGRIEFWSIWAKECTGVESVAYFNERKRHWQHVANSIEMEP